MTYKNWKAISQITNQLFRMAISMLDLKSRYADAIVNGLPQYFQDEPDTEGPVPLSAILAKAEKNNFDNLERQYKDGFSRAHARRLPESFEAIPKEVPLFYFLDPDDPYDYEWDMLPSELLAQFKARGEKEGLDPDSLWTPEIGDVFDYQDGKIIHLEYWTGDGAYFVFAPAERILIDIDLGQERTMLAEEDRKKKARWEAERIANSKLPQHVCERNSDWWKNTFPTLGKEDQKKALDEIERSTCVYCRRHFFIGMANDSEK